MTLDSICTLLKCQLRQKWTKYLWTMQFWVGYLAVSGLEFCYSHFRPKGILVWNKNIFVLEWLKIIANKVYHWQQFQSVKTSKSKRKTTIIIFFELILLTIIWKLFDLFDGLDFPRSLILSSNVAIIHTINHPLDFKHQGHHLSMVEHAGDNHSWMASHVQQIQYLIHLVFLHSWSH